MIDSIRRTLSQLTLKPSSECERHRHPSLSNDNWIIFRECDTENPLNWPLARKRYISAIAVFISLNGCFASSITTGATESITQEFGVSRVAVGLTTSLFLLGFCTGPLIFGPLSEFYGRRWMLYATLLLYLAFTFLTAWPPNFGALLVGRFLAGCTVAGPATIVGGILADLWDKCACGNAMGVFIWAAWVGPALGTVISGAVELKKDWHWGMYVCLWLAAFSCLIMFTIPETHRNTILCYKAKLARKEGHDVQSEQEASKPNLTQLYKIALIRPWGLLLDVIAFLCCIYSCVIAALQYMLFSIYPIVFHDKRGWNVAVSTLPILGQVVGASFALLIVFANSRRRKRKVARGGEIPPEGHMILAMIGGVGFPISMLWLSWSAQYNSVHWIVPTIGGTVLSTCLMLIHVSCFSYIIDTYADYAASAAAVIIVARSSSAAAAPLFTTQMFDALGVGGGGSLIASVAALLSATPFLFYRYGHKIRGKSKYSVS